jgi:hypothetical protein
LYLPNVGGVVSAFGAFNPDGWQRVKFLLFSADYGDKLFGAVLDDFAVKSAVGIWILLF